jgi:hypothetical protein
VDESFFGVDNSFDVILLSTAQNLHIGAIVLMDPTSHENFFFIWHRVVGKCMAADMNFSLLSLMIKEQNYVSN